MRSGDLFLNCRTDIFGLWLQELEQSWKEYNRLEADVNLTKSNLLEKLEALGSPQVPLTLAHTLTFSLCH